MDVRVRDALTRILASTRASRVAIGALANRAGVVDGPLSRVALQVNFGEGAEICTRGRVRSPEYASMRDPIRRVVC